MCNACNLLGFTPTVCHGERSCFKVLWGGSAKDLIQILRRRRYVLDANVFISSSAPMPKSSAALGTDTQIYCFLIEIMDFHKAGKSDMAYQFYTNNISIFISASDSIAHGQVPKLTLWFTCQCWVNWEHLLAMKWFSIDFCLA